MVSRRYRERRSMSTGNNLLFLSETAKALFSELKEIKEAYENGDKLNRRYLIHLAERFGQEIPVAAVEGVNEYLRRMSDHLESGEANAAMIAQANAGMLNSHEELAALEYQAALIDERIE